jgi:hypothetical protein
MYMGYNVQVVGFIKWIMSHCMVRTCVLQFEELFFYTRIIRCPLYDSSITPQSVCHLCCRSWHSNINPLNAELNPICYLLALLGAHHFLHISRIRVKQYICTFHYKRCLPYLILKYKSLYETNMWPDGCSVIVKVLASNWKGNLLCVHSIFIIKLCLNSHVNPK